MNYNWEAGLALIAATVLATLVGKYLLFKIQALHDMREINREQDAEKIAKPKYPPIVKQNKIVGLLCSLVFFLGIWPFFLTLEPRPFWIILINIVVILMVYDFLYYLIHRFAFHGQGYLRRIHSLHHQARKPSYIDSMYVHPLEVLIGTALFMGTIPLLGVVMGPFHIATVTISYLIFVQLNIINHTYVNLPYFPFQTLTWITKKHAIHHENMRKGNYATITLLYDKLFGTLD